jgi:hypothetical protein
MLRKISISWDDIVSACCPAEGLKYFAHVENACLVAVQVLETVPSST